MARLLNALWIITYCTIIITAFGLQIFKHEEPCPLCYLQRVAMLSISVGAFLNLWYGVRIYHYAMILFAALFGGFVAARQICLHICPGFPQFGIPFLGLSLYTWSFISFCSSILMTAILLAIYEPSQEVAPEKHNFPERFACILLTLTAFGNVYSVLHECGLGFCAG